MPKEQKKILMSYSAAECWKSCGEKYWLRYIQRVRPIDEGASLFFGTCIDNALSFLLECKKEGKEHIGLESFKELFVVDKDKGWNLAFDVPKYRYSKSDFDPEVLKSKEDQKLIASWEDELKTTVEKVLKADRIKKYKPMSLNNLKLFSRICWLSLKRKGFLMLDAFIKEVFSKIKRVIAVQHKIVGEIGNIADTLGYVDVICEYENYDTPIVFDIKTSATFYDENSIHFSHQLQQYLAVVGPDLDTNRAGYIVLLKSMKKNDVCVKCNNIRDSAHRTCNQETSEGRCKGSWSSSPEGQTQVLVTEISPEVQERAIQDLTNIAILAAQGLRYKNYNECRNKFGLCDMFYICHYADRSRYTIPKNSEIDKLIPVINNEEN